MQTIMYHIYLVKHNSAVGKTQEWCGDAFLISDHDYQKGMGSQATAFKLTRC